MPLFSPNLLRADDPDDGTSASDSAARALSSGTPRRLIGMRKYLMPRGCCHRVRRGPFRCLRCFCFLVFVFCSMLVFLLASSRLIPRDAYHVTEIEDSFLFDWLHGDYFRPRTEEYSANVPEVFLLQPLPSAPTACTNDTYIVVMVASLPGEVTRRHTVRTTWGQAAITRTWPATEITSEIKLFFVLGQPETDSELVMVQNEADDYQDIVVADFEDTYRNLTIKTMAGLNWLSYNCPQASFVLKADQDTFVHVPRLLNLLYTYHDVFRHAVLGQVAQRPRVVTSGKWAVSWEEYPFSTYPSYPSGPCYVVDSGVVEGLLETSRHVPYFSFEDVFVGSLAKAMGVSRLRVDPFLIDQFHNESFCDFLSARDHHVALTPLTEEQLRTLWEALGTARRVC